MCWNLEKRRFFKPIQTKKSYFWTYVQNKVNDGQGTFFDFAEISI